MVTGGFQKNPFQFEKPCISGTNFLGSTFSISTSIGITLTYILGTIVTVNTVAWIFIGIAIIMCLGLYFIPESPHWLVQMGFSEEASKSLKVWNF